MTEDLQRGLATLRTRATRAEIVLLIFMGWMIARFINEILLFTGIGEINNKVPTTYSTIVGFMTLGIMVVYFVSVVIVSMWIYRAHANVRDAGYSTDYTPAWAIGWFFIPFANLFKPLDAMGSLWYASGGGDDDGESERPKSRKMYVWWATWLSGNILGNVSYRLAGIGDDGPGQFALALSMMSSIALFVCANILRWIISEVTAMQMRNLSNAYSTEPEPEINPAY